MVVNTDNLWRVKSGRYRCFNKPVASVIRVESKGRGSRLVQNLLSTKEQAFYKNDCYRFIVIVFPMESRSLCTISNCRRAIVLVWVVSVILTSPVIFTKVSVAHCQCCDTNSRRISQSADGGNKLGPSAEFWVQGPVSPLQDGSTRLPFTFPRQLPISVRVSNQGRRSTTKVMRHRVCSPLA